jgi:hypothetical protein
MHINVGSANFTKTTQAQAYEIFSGGPDVHNSQKDLPNGQAENLLWKKKGNSIEATKIIVPSDYLEHQKIGTEEFYLGFLGQELDIVGQVKKLGFVAGLAYQLGSNREDLQDEIIEKATELIKDMFIALD